MEHFILVKMVAVVHLLQKKLEIVFVRDSNVRTEEHALVIVDALPEGSEMFIAIPLGVVSIFQRFLCFDISGATTVVKMFQDLDVGDIAVRHEAMLQLGIVLFVKGIT